MYYDGAGVDGRKKIRSFSRKRHIFFCRSHLHHRIIHVSYLNCFMISEQRPATAIGKRSTPATGQTVAPSGGQDQNALDLSVTGSSVNIIPRSSDTSTCKIICLDLRKKNHYNDAGANGTKKSLFFWKTTNIFFCSAHLHNRKSHC